MFRKISPVVVVGLALTLVSLGLYISGPTFVQAISNYAYDAFMRSVNTGIKSGRVAIVDLDEASLQRRELGQWPWPRHLLADLTQKILDAGASVVAFDIVFAEKDRTSPSMIRTNMNNHFKLNVEIKGVPDELNDFDAIFAGVLKKGKTILGCEMMPSPVMVNDVNTAVDPFYETHLLPKGSGNLNEFLMQAKAMTIAIPELLKASKTAFFNAVMDDDNIVRSNPLVWAYGPKRIYPSLSLEAVRLDRNISQCIVDYDEYGITQIRMKDLVIPTDKNGRLVVNYREIFEDAKSGFASSFPTYSAYDVMSGKIEKGALSNKIVFIGTSAVGLKDVRATPLTQNFSGVEVHATMVDNMLGGDTLRIPNWMVGVNVVAILLMGIFLTLFISKGKSWLSFIVSALMILISIKASLMVFEKYHAVFVPVWVILSIMIIYPTLTMIKFWQEELQKKRVRDMFGTMVSENVLHFLENNPGSFSLTGQKREATMFFSDVAGFTTISESLAPDKLSELLNRYLSPMTHIIMDRRGYVDKYEGDAIMAEWGVPYSMNDHAVQACLSAIEQQEKLAEIRPVLKAEFGHEINVRMGINSGSVTAGNMGSDRRFQYTVMGDSVNLAARLEPANKIYGTLIIMGETTYAEAKDSIEARLLDKMVVVGKTVPISIYELVGRKGGISPEKAKVVRLYEEALQKHWERRWDDAIKLLKSALELDQRDGPSAKLLARIEDYRISPPPDGWTGEYVQLRKD